ncbi:MAG: DUF4258 domain-containing protein [Sulfurovum sp.]|nr:DUF4258 domain-containing protein [Sulfurovum sp.]
MKPVRWNEEKNQLLIIQRKLSFEMVLEKMENKEILARKSHPDTKQYPHQLIFVVELEGYICYVPFVENDDEIFFKTIIPSRKLEKELKGKNNGKK